MEVQGQLRVPVQAGDDDKERVLHLPSTSSPGVRPTLRCLSFPGHCCHCYFRLLDFLLGLCSSELDSHQMHRLSSSLQSSSSRRCVHLLQKKLEAATEEEGTGCRERWWKHNRVLELCGSGS